MTDLDLLPIFASVAEAKGFSEAARRLRIPISTVSSRVAELEDRLGVRLLERSTRNLRLTEIGVEVFELAKRSAELGDAVAGIVSNRLSEVKGTLRLTAPPSISDSLLAPLINAFQSSYPNVRIQMLVTERLVDHVGEGVDLAIRLGAFKDSSLVARRLLTYRHQLVASPDYIQKCATLPKRPADLLAHRLLAFSYWKRDTTWAFIQTRTQEKETIDFDPYLTMNDYTGLAAALLEGIGIGELPPIVQPELLRSGRLVEVMPKWHFSTSDLSLLHLGKRHMSKPLRLFKEFAVQMAPTLFPDLPA
jgi:DNA-binding transcriptional LysR family regulator